MFPVCFVDVPFVADIHNSASLLVVVFCRVSLSIVKTSFLDVVCLSQVFLFLHKNHDQKVTWGGKCLFQLTALSLHSITPESQGRTQGKS